jgi:phage terminase large subunit-like protein
VQAVLLGPGSHYGTGFIPKKLIVGKPAAARNIAGMVDYFEVKHVSGGTSWCKIKSYEQHVDTFESDSIDWGWADEEPPEEHFVAWLARFTATDGKMIITFTPTNGPTEVVSHFWPRPDTAARAFMLMDIMDVVISKGGHIPDKNIPAIIAKYPPHQREARTKGIPMMGSGKIYQSLEDNITCEPIEIPDHWPRIVGLDIGGAESPTAMTWHAWDKDADIFYLYDCYAVAEAAIPMHAAAMKARGDWIPCAWPHDGNVQERASGQRYAEIYRTNGCNMLPEHSTHDDIMGEGGFWVEPGVEEIDARMKAGQWKVFRHLLQYFAEYRTYHREKGIIVKKRDHLMDASRMAHMMRRFARMRPTSYATQAMTMATYDPLNPPSGGMVQ